MPKQNYSPRPDGFDAAKVLGSFAKASAEPGVDVASYLVGFAELARFNDMMGTLFATMASDIREQIKILEAFRNSPQGEHYRTVESTIEYEEQEPHRLEPKAKQPSGSRTILHLNRTLDFFRQFVSKMTVMADEDKLSTVCQPAYKATLGKYHSWLLSKAAGIAISTLPTKIQLYERVSLYPYDETVELTAKMVETMDKTFSLIDDLFAKRSLQSLPF
ncbi:putative Ceramide-1-phosphate transfer protein [Hypsibius exemplaris]|uniref:Ceramide-1-phosphate transfer protein n=1 Tax=Hypsibius exemplaris TaxID=2072580 RepID=A0A1W0X8L3_HYPEX|nr:putative Ceramide-1-phosphate transfer protein [Hypsibius exemplaris]